MNKNIYGITKHMNVIVTNQCNRNCPFCIARKNVNKGGISFISLDNIKRAIDFAISHDIKTIALTGGEPTLHPKILEIANMFKIKNLMFQFTLIMILKM